MNRIKYLAAKAAVRLATKLKQQYENINLYYLTKGLRHLGSNPIIEAGFQVMNPQCVSIGDDFTARARVQLRAYTDWEDTSYAPSLLIGNNVHLATDVLINCMYRIEIGDGCGIGVGSKIMDHAHGLGDYSDLETHIMKRVLTSKGGVLLHKNVLVGTGVVILDGVEIGENSIIGSNAVVTRSIPPNSIAAGIPARVIKTISPK